MILASPRRPALMGLERMMKSVPNFAPRRSGTMVVCRARASPKAFCCDCADQCGGETCPYLAERLAAGVASYNELAVAAFLNRNHNDLLRRVEKLSALAGGFRFRSELHRSRFAAWLDPAGARAGPRWLAAVYLLSARGPLWQRVGSHIFPSLVCWEDIFPGTLDLQSYVLYKAAKGLYGGELDIRPEELADRELVSDDTLLLVVNAVLLVRYGKAASENTENGRFS